jgi:hypothetical protein
MAGNPMISVCVRLQNIHSHKPELYQGKSFEAVEDMISVDLFQDRIKARFRDPHQIICYYKQEVFLNRIYWVKFLCKIPERIPSVPVSTSTEFISYRFIRNTRAATIFAPFKSRLDFKRKFYSKTCITMGIGNLTQVCLVRVDLLY